MKAIAWVVEIMRAHDPDDDWTPSNSYSIRAYARKAARNLRMVGWLTRVRQYVRVEARK